MQVKDVMSKNVILISPDQPICEAARMMAQNDAGALPVRENDRLIGVITDRDIAVRAVAEEKSPRALVREIMSHEILYCYEDEDTESVARNMSENQVRRLPVLNRDKRLVGIVSFGDVSQGVEPSVAGEAIAGISKQGGTHSHRTH